MYKQLIPVLLRSIIYCFCWWIEFYSKVLKIFRKDHFCEIINFQWMILICVYRIWMIKVYSSLMTLDVEYMYKCSMANYTIWYRWITNRWSKLRLRSSTFSIEHIASLLYNEWMATRSKRSLFLGFNFRHRLDHENESSLK